MVPTKARKLISKHYAAYTKKKKSVTTRLPQPK